LRGIRKSFGAICANAGIDLDLFPGKIHAILGANGAGKSTLMSILAGSYVPDAGTIRIHGRLVSLRSPADALKAGIGMVHQHSMLIDSMTVAENLSVGDRSAPLLLDRRERVRRVAALARHVGFGLDPDARVADLAVAQCQQVEILRNLASGVAVLILDEPTAVLAPQEADGLFATIRTLAAGGASIVLISHKLDEALAISQRISVLRDGLLVHTGPAREVSPSDLVALMIGAPGRPAPAPMPRPHVAGEPVAVLRGVTVENDAGTTELSGVDLQVLPGEILGVAGLAGSGQAALAQVLSGHRPPTAGTVVIGGANLTGQTVRVFHRHGVRTIPADRCGRGLATELSLGENAMLTWLSHGSLGRGPWLPRSAVWRFGAKVADAMAIEPSDPGRPARLLSGGSMQKLIVGRETLEPARLLVAEYPLRGLDVPTTAVVEERLRFHAASGTAIVFISEDLDELLAVADRIVVMVRGRIVAQRTPQVTDRLELGLLMMGQPGNE